MTGGKTTATASHAERDWEKTTPITLTEHMMIQKTLFAPEVHGLAAERHIGPNSRRQDNRTTALHKPNRFIEVPN